MRVHIPRKGIEMKTAEQIEIIEYLRYNPNNVQIGAVAGSGKTTTLLWAIRDVFADKRVLVVSFTKKVAENMNKKLAKSGLHLAQAMNMHRIGYRFLSGSGYNIDVDENKMLNIAYALVTRYHKSEDAKMFMKSVDVSRVAALTRVVKIRNITDTDVLEIAINHGYDDSDDPTRDATIPAVHEIAYEAIKLSDMMFEQEGICDFDDMIVQPLRLNLPVPREFAGTQVAMIDEVQDLNEAQRALFFRTINSNVQIVSAGDAFQSMFSFAGADADSYDRMMEMMNDHGPTVEKGLSVTFRCALSHVVEAKKYVPHIVAHDGAFEGSMTVIEQDHIQDYLDTDKTSMIISRWNRVLVNAALSMIRHGLIVKVVGKDLDRRILGFGRQAIENWDMGFNFATDFSSALNAYEASRINDMRSQDKPDSRINEVVDLSSCCKIMYREFMSFVNDPSESLRVMESTYTNNHNNFTKYVRDMLVKDKYDVLGMSIHKAKGSEAEQVFILGADDLPYTYDEQSDREFEEEQRIHYVAITRSSDEIYLVNNSDRSGRVVLDVYEGGDDPYKAAMALLGMKDEDEEEDDHFDIPLRAPVMPKSILDD
jgi:DNA helicase II / ATP-dependent DNA helicase PcrA